MPISVERESRKYRVILKALKFINFKANFSIVALISTLSIAIAMKLLFYYLVMSWKLISQNVWEHMFGGSSESLN